MISVLIPTYNYTCYKLVSDIHEQLERSGVKYEVIVAEDGSKDQVSIIANQKIAELPNCKHIINKENLGRARIINFLINESKGDWCVIMDSDAQVVTTTFIKTYADYSKTDSDVIVGSLVNPEKPPMPNATLRYKYEKAAEKFRTVEYRNANPYARFTTFNFMARRSVLLEVPFDERCIEYGYEDTLMGLELKRKGKEVLHIDNPLMHLGFDSNSVFLRKTETSLHSLKKIEKDMLPYTPLGRMVIKLRSMSLASIVCVIFKLAQPLLKANLLGNKPNLIVFSFYKLGYYLSL
jgi:glycosyltransferase involved in cell wall biosynthesis